MAKVSAEEAREHVESGGLFRLACEPGFSIGTGGEVRGIRVQVGSENPTTGKVRWKDGPYIMGMKGEPASYLSSLKAAVTLLDGSATLPGEKAAV